MCNALCPGAGRSRQEGQRKGDLHTPTKCACEVLGGTGIAQREQSPTIPSGRLFHVKLHSSQLLQKTRELTRLPPRWGQIHLAWAATFIGTILRPSSLYSLSRRAQPDPISPRLTQMFLLNICTAALLPKRQFIILPTSTAARHGATRREESQRVRQHSCLQGAYNLVEKDLQRGKCNSVVKP